MKKVIRCVGFCVCLFVSWLGIPALAQTFPTKPITLIVALAPGGVGDITARAIARKMGESLGQPVVVENRPGAGQILGLNLAAKSAPDGYTLVVVGSGNAITQLLFKKLPYNVMHNFTYISTMAYYDLAIVTSPTSPYNNLQDLVKAAKANPGKLNIATINVGTTQNLTAQLLKSVSGINVTVVPYKSTAEVVNAILSGEVQAGIEMIPPILGSIESKTLKVLAITANERFAGLPDVPTAVESGFPGLEVSAWNGIAGPANIPAPVLDRLNKAIRAALDSKDVVSLFRRLGADARSSTPEEELNLMESSLPVWNTVIKNAKIKRQ